jgi:PadR family transcriptional regulator PadR
MPRGASDLLHGTLDVLILKTLSWDAMHGYAIAEWIEKRGGGELVIVDAAREKSQHSRENSGANVYEWGV